MVSHKNLVHLRADEINMCEKYHVNVAGVNKGGMNLDQAFTASP